MFKTLTEKASKFAALHPQVVMYGISIGVTLGIALSLIVAMSPHEAHAGWNGSALAAGAMASTGNKGG